MINLRKKIIPFLLNSSGSNTYRNYMEILRISRMSQTKIKKYQQNKLKDLLIYSYKEVPYYRKILGESGVIVNNKIRLNKFKTLPILNKEILRNNFDDLKSCLYKNRNPYINSSGGSTGEPVLFIQDKFYNEWNIANKLFFAHLLDKEIGEPEIKIWGSERDIVNGTIGIKAKGLNFIYNRKLLNSFLMTDKDMINYIDIINSFKPKQIWAYVDSIFQLSKFIMTKQLYVYPTNSIIVTAGTLTEDMRGFIQKAFHSRVYNQYGSREVGGIAAECSMQHGLHIFDWTHYIETVNERVVVTLLTNYSMPLIRYDIGDTANLCKGYVNDLQTNRIKNVTGRYTDHFLLKNGSLVHGEYFTHLLYFKPWIKTFRIVQEDYNKINCYIVPIYKPQNNDLKKIIKNIKIVMGKNCNINFVFKNKLSPTPSGKNRYIISLISRQ